MRYAPADQGGARRSIGGEKETEDVMAKGLWRDGAGWVRMDFDQKFEMLMKRSDYEDHGYKPTYSALPLKQKAMQPARAKKTK